MIALQFKAGDIRCAVSTDAHYSPDILDDLANTAQRSVLDAIAALGNESEAEADPDAAPELSHYESYLRDFLQLGE